MEARTKWIMENAPKDGGYVRMPENEMNIQDIVVRNPSAFVKDPEGFLASFGHKLPPHMSLAAVKEKASNYSKAIFSDWAELQNILDRHEETIRTRWGKKSGKNRKRLFFDIWPEIPQEHRPEWRAMTAAAEKR
jgi:hypothetical protein